MEKYNPNQYGKRIAAVYDNMYSSVDDACLDLLTEISKNGRILELGIGTGRIALPLKARGVNIHGIDISPEMPDQLQKKQSGDKIAITIGDFSTMPVEGSFDLIFVVFNTFYGLITKELQQLCLENVRLHLKEKGHF